MILLNIFLHFLSIRLCRNGSGIIEPPALSVDLLAVGKLGVTSEFYQALSHHIDFCLKVNFQDLATMLILVFLSILGKLRISSRSSNIF